MTNWVGAISGLKVMRVRVVGPCCGSPRCLDHSVSLDKRSAGWGMRCMGEDWVYFVNLP